MRFGEGEHWTTATTSWTAVRLHVGANWNAGQNDLKIKILEKGLKHRIHRITLDSDLMPLVNTIKAASNHGMPARRHHIAAMRGYKSIKYSPIPITQNHEAIFSVATSPTNQSLQERIEVGCF